MPYDFWNSLYAGWGWFLWFAVWVLLVSSIGHWGYSYRVNRRASVNKHKTALDMLNERYARGEIKRDEFTHIKAEIAPRNPTL
ncbi:MULTISPECIES: SHOCT domain-containing protein [unclassified Pantoea]|jgi:putative membrane protein|uniref:SHOCT domain-containing protein n=1 Tax=unclassified Pantoea TaxID=2630326 RepID=UPI0023D9A2B5|nr:MULTISPECIES: SHOCT domain-containing protein [unclassified Pantoea]MDF2043812.1 SHOCT domain-containing protein [Pantoea sp. Cr_R14]MDF2069811.1 SHOCT domain-containing protein [Pantoea sp. Cr_R13]MDF2081414.1 SHOCT domain-containing protein [Pantoea sp. Cr_R21]